MQGTCAASNHQALKGKQRTFSLRVGNFYSFGRALRNIYNKFPNGTFFASSNEGTAPEHEMLNIIKRFRKFSSVLPFMILSVPHVALAGQIEAIWEISLYAQTDMPSFTDESISVPAQFQIRTVFDDNIHSTDEIFSDHSMTFLGIPPPL